MYIYSVSEAREEGIKNSLLITRGKDPKSHPRGHFGNFQCMLFDSGIPKKLGKGDTEGHLYDGNTCGL